MPRDRKVTEHARRQRIIFRRVVLDNHPTTISEISRLIEEPKYDKTRAARDVEAFCLVGCEVRLRDSIRCPGEQEMVFLEGTHMDDDSIREGINTEGKHIVAKLTAGVICGLPSKEEEDLVPPWLLDESSERAIERLFANDDRPERSLPEIRSLLQKIREKVDERDPASPLGEDAILALLNRSDLTLHESIKSLRNRLLDYWTEANRLVAIDSGTTNIMLARNLRELRMPIAGSSLCSLSVCTNSRRIFELLGPSDVQIKTIIIGGQQKFRSPTIAGAMAESFLRASSILQFGICVLGATKIDVQQFAACSDSQEESSIKQLMMEKSSLRVIAVDSSKFQYGPGRAGYKFASLDKSQIDLIITNSVPLLDEHGEPNLKAHRRLRNFIHAVESRGIPVLVGSSDQTYGHPYDRDPGE